MNLLLDVDIINLINDVNTVKALSTSDKNGVTHLVFKDSISCNVDGSNDGNIRFLELNETSRTNKNMIYSLWFKRLVSINILSAGEAGVKRRSYQIKGIPVKAIICGAEFEKNYSIVRDRLGPDADLSTIWVIEPREMREETAFVRIQAERRDYPLLGHLDRYTGNFGCN
jgi:hypothetical protein